MDISSIATTGMQGAARLSLPSKSDSVSTQQSAQSLGRGPQAASEQATRSGAERPLEDAVSSIQQFVQTVQRNLNFSLDESTGKVVVKVTDGASGEVIRQIPSEDALRLAESLEQARGLLFKAEA